MPEDLLRLEEFIAASKEKGASDEFLATFLSRRGWPADDVYGALGSYWERATGQEVPQRKVSREPSRDAFLYLLSFSTLATWSSALGSMLFRLIERWIPDPVSHDYYYNLRNSVTWQMASIAVAFPIFLLVMRIILNEAQEHPERLQSAVRKWLTYVALLLTAGGMICDLIWFLDYFLTGELSSRFVLKSLTVMLICGSIFIYYLSSLGWDRHTNVALAKCRSLAFGFAAFCFVVVSFCIGLGVAGTPGQQRQLEADRKRVQDLQKIVNSIRIWHSRATIEKSNALLPATLNDLGGRGLSTSDIADPETKVPYEYRVLPGNSYQLCATFSAANERGELGMTPFWSHDAGRTCFTLEASRGMAWER